MTEITMEIAMSITSPPFTTAIGDGSKTIIQNISSKNKTRKRLFLFKAVLRFGDYYSCNE